MSSERSPQASSAIPPRLARRLNRAEEKPRLALENGWFEDPEFCRRFFDRCEHQAMLTAPEALEMARRAVEIADRSGDPHLANRSVGVLSHAYIARCDLYWAARVLEYNQSKALACCPDCRCDHLRRVGDLNVEQRQPEESLAALDQCLLEGGRRFSRDDFGRVYFLRGIAYHHRGDRGQALEDGGRTLRQLSLDSPQGYFLDIIALLAFFIGGGGPHEDAVALDHLARFRDRIKGKKGWRDVRTRASWVEGHLYARLEDARRARQQLEKAQSRLLTDGLAREAVAASVDLGQLRCRHGELREDNLRIARRVLTSCLEMRSDLTDDHRRGLEEARRVLERYPESAFGELGAFRKSMVAPVPGRLDERVGKS